MKFKLFMMGLADAFNEYIGAKIYPALFVTAKVLAVAGLFVFLLWMFVNLFMRFIEDGSPLVVLAVFGTLGLSGGITYWVFPIIWEPTEFVQKMITRGEWKMNNSVKHL